MEIRCVLRDDRVPLSSFTSKGCEADVTLSLGIVFFDGSAIDISC